MISITASNSLLVTIDETRKFCQATADTSSPWELYIKSATTKVETLLNRQIRAGTVKAITKIKPPEQMILAPWDENGLSVTKGSDPVDLDEFYTERERGLIGPRHQNIYHRYDSYFDRPLEYYEFLLTLGWTADTLPEEIKMEILMMVKESYITRSRRIAKDSRVAAAWAQSYMIPVQHLPEWRVA